MAKVSVIVPAYNAERYLAKCLDSLVSLTLDDLEIIVVNDCSKDNTAKILEEYCQKYDFIKVINHEVNKGIGITRNDGIKAASGKYLGFVDSDDYVDAEMYEVYYKACEEGDLSMVCSGYWEHEGDNVNPIEITPFEASTMKDNPELLINIELGPWNKLYRTEDVKKAQLEFPSGVKYEDLPFVAKALSLGKVGYVTGNYYHYLIHSGSESTTFDKRTFDIIKVLKMVKEYYGDRYHDEVEMLSIVHLTRHMLKQKNQKDKQLKYEFVDKAYRYLDDTFPDWRNNRYYRKQSAAKRLIKDNKKILKLFIR